jgi:hypothetical protein
VTEPVTARALDDREAAFMAALDAVVAFYNALVADLREQLDEVERRAGPVSGAPAGGS